MNGFLNFITKQFTNFRKNKKIDSTGIKTFMDDLNAKVNISAEALISPHNKNHTINWLITRNEDNTLECRCRLLRYRLTYNNFANFIISYVKKHQFLVILLRNKTNNYVQENEITELWGYRIIMLDDIILTETVAHTELFESTTPNPSYVYCGPEGKIFGGDELE